MSTHIEYRHLALSLSTAEATKDDGGTLPPGSPDTLYLMLCECGDSNVTRMVHGSDGRMREVLAKDWRLRCIGSFGDVIEEACRIADGVVGGCIAFRTARPSGSITPETYIRRYRRSLEHAAGHWDALVPLMHSRIVIDCTEAVLATRPYLFNLLNAPARLIPSGCSRYSLALRPGENDCAQMVRDLMEVYLLRQANPTVDVYIKDIGYLDELVSKSSRKAA